MRVIVNPTWRCQFSCPYCWVRAMGWHKLYRRHQERHWHDWAVWVSALPEASSIDFSGGEPFVYPGMVELLRVCADAHVAWAVTTNLDNAGAWHDLTTDPIEGCLGINVSWHPQSPPDLSWRIRRLHETGYPVFVNLVSHPNAPELGDVGKVHVNHIPYQPWQEGLAVDGIKRQCTAGMAHVACDPLGRVYRCLVAMQTGQEPLGTIDDDLHDIALKESAPCDFGCSTCYTVSPASWAVGMEAIP